MDRRYAAVQRAGQGDLEEPFYKPVFSKYAFDKTQLRKSDRFNDKFFNTVKTAGGMLKHALPYCRMDDSKTLHEKLLQLLRAFGFSNSMMEAPPMRSKNLTMGVFPAGKSKTRKLLDVVQESGIIDTMMVNDPLGCIFTAWASLPSHYQATVSV